MNETKPNALRDELTPVGSLRRKAHRLAGSPGLKPGELERVILRLHRCGEGAYMGRQQDRERIKYRSDAAKAGIEKCADLPTDYEENPLDDQEKLDEVRRAVFGSAPGSD